MLEKLDRLRHDFEYQFERILSVDPHEIVELKVEISRLKRSLGAMENEGPCMILMNMVASVLVLVVVTWYLSK